MFIKLPNTSHTLLSLTHKTPKNCSHRVIPSKPQVSCSGALLKSVQKRSRLTRVSLRYILRQTSCGRDLGASFQFPKHSSSPLTDVTNGCKSFLSLHILLLFTQWRVFTFFYPPSSNIYVWGSRFSRFFPITLRS